MRREQLSDGRNVLRGYGGLASHDLVFPLRDVKLVEPSENLDIGMLLVSAVLVADLSPKAVDHGMFRKKIIRQEQFGLVIELLENVGQQLMVITAGGENKVSIHLTLWIRRRDVAIKEIVETVRVGVALQVFW